MTIFVYLNNVHKGGRTRWRWTNHDAALGGEHGTRFYDRPNCGSGRTAVEGGSGVEVSIEPREGMGVIHFPAMLPEVCCLCLTRATATAAIYCFRSIGVATAVAATQPSDDMHVFTPCPGRWVHGLQRLSRGRGRG